MINGKISIGILGCSRVAKKSVLPALLKIQNVTIGMIGARNKQDAAECATMFGCSESGTYQDVINNPRIDIIYISLPNSLHEEWAIKAAAAGKHIWCEKPAAPTYTATQNMVRAANKNNVRIMEGFMFLSHPQHAQVQNLIATNTIGKPSTFRGVFTYPMPDSVSTRMQPSLGGGALLDAAVYPIRAARMIFNTEPLSVTAKLAVDSSAPVDTHCEILMTFPNNQFAHITAAFGMYFQSTYEILGSNGRIKAARAYAVPSDMSTKIILDQNDAITETIVPAEDHFALMAIDFISEIQRTEPIRSYESDMLAQSKVIEACLISNKEDRTIYLSENIFS